MTDTRGRGLLHVQIDIDPAHEEEFNRWYNEEHFPAISGFWGVLEGRRFRAVDNPHRYLAYYDLKSPDVLESPDYQKVRTLDAAHLRQSAGTAAGTVGCCDRNPDRQGS